MLSVTASCAVPVRLPRRDRKSTRLNSSHTVIYTLSLHDALPISPRQVKRMAALSRFPYGMTDAQRDSLLRRSGQTAAERSEEHTSELQSHSDLHSFPTRRSSDLSAPGQAHGSTQPLSVRHDGCSA